MSTTNIFVADPYDKNHIELFKNFEKENNKVKKVSPLFEKIITTSDKKTYLKNKTIDNNINEVLFIKGKNNIKDFCYITGEKDIKTCKLYFPDIDTKNKNRLIVKAATDYSINYLQMETVFVMTDESNKALIKNLENLSYESLGNDDNTLTYMIEREKIINKERII